MSGSYVAARTARPPACARSRPCAGATCRPRSARPCSSAARATPAAGKAEPPLPAAAGLRAIAALRWRELSTLVGQAMQQRGLRHAGRGHGEAAPPGDGSRLLMTDGSQRWLLACKHGSAYRLGSHHVTELAAEMELA